MTETEFTIETQNAVEFFGINDKNINYLRNIFPQLKIVARDKKIKINGEEKGVALFSDLFGKMQDFFNHFNKIDPDDIQKLYNDSIELNSSLSFIPKEHSDALLHGRNGKLIRARTVNQHRMVKSIEENDMLFAIGPAGTGKTYTAVALAVRALKNKEVQRIVLTRPAVEAGENLGFLPGDLKDKLDPYLQPLYDALRDMIPTQKLVGYLEDGTIEIAPLAFMRGRTLESAFAILDEAQNCTEMQLKMFLTRMGQSSKFVITGDITQIDLPRNQRSGLVQAKQILKGIKGIDFIDLDMRDVVRHKIVTAVINAYERKEFGGGNSEKGAGRQEFGELKVEN